MAVNAVPCKGLVSYKGGRHLNGNEAKSNRGNSYVE